MPGVSKARPVKLVPTVERCCLKCNKAFNSESRVNRLCADCNADNIKLSSLASGARIMHEYGGRSNNSYMYEVGESY